MSWAWTLQLKKQEQPVYPFSTVRRADQEKHKGAKGRRTSSFARGSVTGGRQCRYDTPALMRPPIAWLGRRLTGRRPVNIRRRFTRREFRHFSYYRRNNLRFSSPANFTKQSSDDFGTVFARPHIQEYCRPQDTEEKRFLPAESWPSRISSL